mgnify:CR=1 FL=1
MNDLMTKLVTILTMAQIRAQGAFLRTKIPQLTTPLTVVDCAITLEPVAIGNLFGRDSADGYYRCQRAEYTALLDTYAPYNGNGALMIRPIIRKLVCALDTVPAGYRLLDIQVGQTHYDADSDCYINTIKVRYETFPILKTIGGTV